MYTDYLSTYFKSIDIHNLIEKIYIENDHQVILYQGKSLQEIPYHNFYRLICLYNLQYELNYDVVIMEKPVTIHKIYKNSIINLNGDIHNIKFGTPNTEKVDVVTAIMDRMKEKKRKVIIFYPERMFNSILKYSYVLNLTDSKKELEIENNFSTFKKIYNLK